MARVVARNPSKTLAAGVSPVRSVSYEAGDKSFLTLLGASGCVKSTILRMTA